MRPVSVRLCEVDVTSPPLSVSHNRLARVTLPWNTGSSFVPFFTSYFWSLPPSPTPGMSLKRRASSHSSGSDSRSGSDSSLEDPKPDSDSPSRDADLCKLLSKHVHTRSSVKRSPDSAATIGPRLLRGLAEDIDTLIGRTPRSIAVPPLLLAIQDIPKNHLAGFSAPATGRLLSSYCRAQTSGSHKVARSWVPVDNETAAYFDSFNILHDIIPNTRNPRTRFDDDEPDSDTDSVRDGPPPVPPNLIAHRRVPPPTYGVSSAEDFYAYWIAYPTNRPKRISFRASIGRPRRPKQVNASLVFSGLCPTTGSTGRTRWMDRLARFFLNSPADIHALWATIRLGCEMGDIRMNNQLVSLSPLDVPGGFLEENMGPFTENGNDRSLALALGVWLIRL